MHTVALGADGRLYTWGCNDEGALGRHGDEVVPSPAEGLDGVRVIKAKAGDSHTCVLTDDGRVFATGSFRDASGEWAFSETSLKAVKFEQIYPPTHRSSGQDHAPAIDMDSGSSHVIVLAEGGTVFTMGVAEQGQLGRVTKNKSERGATFRTLSKAKLPDDFVEELKRRRTTPSCLQNLLTLMPVKCQSWTARNPVVKVFAGGYSSMAVTQDGRVYGWGLNNYGQVRRMLADARACECFVSYFVYEHRELVA